MVYPHPGPSYSSRGSHKGPMHSKANDLGYAFVKGKLNSPKTLAEP